MIIPRFLKADDKVAIVAPAGKPDKDLLEAGIRALEAWGLQVSVGNNVYSRSHGYLAGSDAERLVDLQQMLDSEDVAAVFCARGGYGCSRIVDQLDLSKSMNKPKWLVGYSDITALHLKFNKTGIASIHGEVPVHFSREPYADAVWQLQQLLFGKWASIQSKATAKQIPGNVTAEVIGGNLSLMIDALGTTTDPDTTKKILILEEVDEYYYKVDRMLNHLLRAGKLSKLAGLVIGQFSAIKDTRQAFNESVEDIVLQKCAKFGYPIAFNFPVGHEPFNQSWIHGAKANLVVDDKIAELNYLL